MFILINIFQITFNQRIICIYIYIYIYKHFKGKYEVIEYNLLIFIDREILDCLRND